MGLRGPAGQRGIPGDAVSPIKYPVFQGKFTGGNIGENIPVKSDGELAPFSLFDLNLCWACFEEDFVVVSPLW